MTGEAIAAQIGKLWYPSADDVAVYDKAMQLIMVIQHEEVLCIV